MLWQNDCNGKRLKTSGCKNETRESKTEAESDSGKPVEKITRPPDPPKQDYIHVRARRGQATDSHSLAERVIYFVLFNHGVIERLLVSTYFHYCRNFKGLDFRYRDNHNSF